MASEENNPNHEYHHIKYLMWNINQNNPLQQLAELRVGGGGGVDPPQ